MMWTEAEQEVSVDIVTLRGALLCLSPVNLPCLMHTLIKTLLFYRGPQRLQGPPGGILRCKTRRFD